jgi:hypothetical protein
MTSRWFLKLCSSLFLNMPHICPYVIMLSRRNAVALYYFILLSFIIILSIKEINIDWKHQHQLQDGLTNSSSNCWRGIIS